MTTEELSDRYVIQADKFDRGVTWIVDTSTDETVGHVSTAEIAKALATELNLSAIVSYDPADALRDILSWLDRAGWTAGHAKEHQPRIDVDLDNGSASLICRCREPWPCPYVRAQASVS